MTGKKFPDDDSREVYLLAESLIDHARLGAPSDPSLALTALIMATAALTATVQLKPGTTREDLFRTVILHFSETYKEARDGEHPNVSQRKH